MEGRHPLSEGKKKENRPLIKNLIVDVGEEGEHGRENITISSALGEKIEPTKREVRAHHLTAPWGKSKKTSPLRDALTKKGSGSQLRPGRQHHAKWNTTQFCRGNKRRDGV